MMWPCATSRTTRTRRRLYFLHHIDATTLAGCKRTWEKQTRENLTRRLLNCFLQQAKKMLPNQPVMKDHQAYLRLQMLVGTAQHYLGKEHQDGFQKPSRT